MSPAEIATTRTRRFMKGLFAAAAVAAAAPAATAADVPGILTAKRRDALVDVVDKVKSAVVNIHSERTVAAETYDPFRQPTPLQTQRVNGMGTGIVLDPRGYIVTNFHVIDDVQALRVRTLDGRSVAARVLATDKKSDLAVIKIETGTTLPTVPLGTATDLLDAEQVIAIGNSYGYEHTTSVGYIAAKGRDVTLNKEISYFNLIQTTTPINPGNSGGPLFNKKGELVGVNVAIRAGANNIAFAIPVDAMIDRAADMMSLKRRTGIRHGLVLKDHVERPTEESVARRWATVEAVEPNSPAAAAGVKPGDTVEKAGDVAVLCSLDIERGFLDAAASSKVTLTLKRAGEPATAELQLAAAEKPATPADAVQRRTGLKLVAVGKESVVRVDPALRGGMAVVDVAVGSVAAKAGLQRGDVLIGLHLWETLNADNVLYVLNHKDAATFSPAKVFFLRDGRLRESQLVAGGE